MQLKNQSPRSSNYEGGIKSDSITNQRADYTPRESRLLLAIAESGDDGVLSIDLARIAGYAHSPRGIIELRRAGWKVETAMEPFVDRDGRTTRLARYTLDPSQRAQAIDMLGAA